MNTTKQTVVDTIVSKIAKEPNFILIKFDKTNHQTLESLRKELKKSNATLHVVKNTLLEKAFNKLGQKNKQFRDVKKRFTPIREVTALLTLEGDWSGGLRAFQTFSEKEKSLGFKFGILDSITYDGTEVVRIAKLPGKNELIGKLLGSFQSPSSHMVRAMKFNMQKFVYILSQKSKSN